MDAGIGQPSTRSLKGHVVSRSLDLCCWCVRCTIKKASQILLKLYASNPSLYPSIVSIHCIHDLPRRSLICVGR